MRTSCVRIVFLLGLCVPITRAFPPAPESNYIIDAKPRTVATYVDIYVYDANTAEGGIGVCDIVDISGKVVERLASKVQPISGEQVLHIDASEWSAGMYFLFISDRGSRNGTIKLLKVGH